MFRSARQGRTGKKIKGAHDHHLPESKSFHPAPPSNRKPSKKKSKSDSLQGALDQDEIYDYQADNHNRRNRLNSNQIDDHRLTGSSKRIKSKPEEEDVEGMDDMDRIDDLVERYQQENDNGFGFVNSEDDESIDSDEAMGQSDDQHKTKKSNRKTKTPKHSRNFVKFAESGHSNHSETSEDESDSNHDDFIDASTMLDIGAESDNAFSDEEDETGDSDSNHLSDSDSEEIGEDDLSDFEEEDESKLENLAKIVDNLNSLSSQKRKESTQGDLIDSTDGPTKKRKLLPVQTESRAEGEILPSVNSLGNLQGQVTDRVKLEDLLSTLSSTPGLSEFKKILKPLSLSSKSTKAGPISAPLETLRQQKIERQIAYELTKKEMAKWDQTTRMAQGLSGRNTDGKNRFIIPADKISSNDKEPDANRWNMHFTPINQLENEVLGMLQSSQISSKKLLQEEAEQTISEGVLPQKIREKTIESKMARELMFRAERKAKRIAKIKSKTFRRIRKKEKQRNSLSGRGEEPELDFLEELDEIDGGDRAKSKTEEMEIERARERVTLKHSNQGQWAKKVAGLKGLGSDANTAIQERIRREELLKKKISGVNSDDSDPVDQDSDFDSDGELGVEDIKAHALKQLAELDAEKSSANSDDPPFKGLFAMKFMQRAMAVKDRKAEEARAELRRQLLEEEDEANSEVDEQNISHGMKVQGNPGRLVFNPDAFPRIAKQSIEPDEHNQNDPDKPSNSISHPTTKTSGPHLRVMALNGVQDAKNDRGIEPQTTSESVAHVQVEPNPWLTLSTSNNSGTISKIKDLNPNSTKYQNSTSITAEKAKLKAEKRKRKHASQKEIAREDAKVDIDLKAFMGPKVLESMENDNDDEGRCDQDAIIRTTDQVDSLGRTAFEQRELVKEAFADDGVVVQFQEEKRKQIDKDAPKELDITLPGWGDWVGKGSKKTKHSKKFIKKIGGVNEKQRKDFNMKDVIILESGINQKNKNLNRFQLKDLPFPYTHQQQLELDLNHSIGPEFNTRLNHRHLTRPDILSKPGTLIQPVDKPV